MNTKFDLITESNCGITVSSEDPIAIRKTIETIYKLSIKKRKEMGHNGKIYLKKHHSYEQIAKKYSRLFDELCY